MAEFDGKTALAALDSLEFTWRQITGGLNYARSVIDAAKEAEGLIAARGAVLAARDAEIARRGVVIAEQEPLMVRARTLRQEVAALEAQRDALQASYQELKRNILGTHEAVTAAQDKLAAAAKGA